MDKLFTTHDISRLLKADPSTVSKWIDKGMLLAFRTPGGHRRVRQTDLRAFLQQHHMPLPDEVGTGTVRLLVVDDERLALDAIRRQLRPLAGLLTVETVTSGIEALLLIAEAKPQAMLIDINMPEVDGYEVLRRVRTREQFDSVKLIAMTGKLSAQVEKECLAAGAVACLAKPVDREALLALLSIEVPAARAG